MSSASRPISTGKTRTCPHCKATILESLSICPGCMHHLRFDSEAAKRQVAAAPALQVEGLIRHPPLEPPLEYYVIIAVRNDRGEEVTRQVVNVGALQPAEKRTFTLSVEVLPPQAPVTSKSSSSTGTFKSPIAQPTATVRPATPPAGAGPATGSKEPTAPTPTSSQATPTGIPPAAPKTGTANTISPGGKSPTSNPSNTPKPQTTYPGGVKPPMPGGPKRH
jgi:hypothetical protein